jgi:hypothetical protein
MITKTMMTMITKKHHWDMTLSKSNNSLDSRFIGFSLELFIQIQSLTGTRRKIRLKLSKDYNDLGAVKVNDRTAI